MSKIVEKYAELPKPMRRPLWKVWHNMIVSFDKQASAVFMNYGYASDNGEFNDLNLKKEDEADRYSIQLYDHVAKNYDLRDKDILEVGSGRGGGASFLSRYYQPKTYTGLDISKKNRDFCNTHHNVNGLKFVKGYAEKLPFENASFDALVNVESARCYGSIPAFFGEVFRVLKPEGEFLFADMIKPEDIETINKQLDEARFVVAEKKNIRENVVKALVLDSKYRKERIDKKIPKFMQKSFYQFAGIEGSERFDAFDKNRIDYWSYTLKKK